MTKRGILIAVLAPFALAMALLAYAAILPVPQFIHLICGPNAGVQLCSETPV